MSCEKIDELLDKTSLVGFEVAALLKKIDGVADDAGQVFSIRLLVINFICMLMTKKFSPEKKAQFYVDLASLEKGINDETD